MPDLGIGEGLAALLGGGSDLFAGLFGGGEAAAGATAGDTAALVGGAADAAATGGGLTGTIADLAGTTGATAFLDPAAAQAASAGLAGGPSFAGTIADSLAPAAAAGVGGGLAAGGTALDSSVFSTGTSPVFNSSGISDVVGGAGGATPSSPISSLLNANAGPVPGGSSVFNTGTSPLTGVSGTGAPSATVPGGGGAAGAAAPSSITAPTDATAAGAGGAAPAAGGATAPTSSLSDLLSKAVGGAEKSLTSNPLGIALGVGGLGYNILEGQKNTANEKALTADAQQATANSNQLVGQGEALQQYLTSGTLPPQYMAQVTQALQDAKTAAISNAAAQGQPTDPTQNTALAATLAKIDQQEPGMISQIASTLASSGQGLINAGQGAAGLSGSLYSSLVQNDTAQAANTGKAIASLAAALNGKSQAGVGGTTITVG